MTESRVIAATAIATGALIAVLYAVIGGIDDWGGVAVVAGVFLTTAGTMIALDPLRRD